MSGKSIRQNGTRFYWRNEQDPDSYTIYRKDVSDKESRNLADISQQELKNAICKTLTEKGPMSKDPLLRESIHTMGYKRSTTSLLEAIQRGLKYGKKTGEILLNEAKLYYLKDM